MRLLHFDSSGKLRLTKELVDGVDKFPPYAILSHTWRGDEDEVTFGNVQNGTGESKAGHRKIQFCGRQAKKDGLDYFWVDTCCINKDSHSELSEAITSMFRWYRDAAKCYVYLSDVSRRNTKKRQGRRTWKLAFRRSWWFKRGWTLQELLAPRCVEFFSREGDNLGTKASLEQQIHEITGIPLAALRGAPLSDFDDDERMRWAESRETKKKEDKAYCLLGILRISMSLRYGEGDEAFKRLKEKVQKRAGGRPLLLVI